MTTRAADLAVFVPRCLAPLLRHKRSGPPARTAVGTVLFCDVSGFTPMTEALSVLGREGAEELTRVLNAYFTRMIGIIEAEGGDVLRFGGDAMTVLFEEPEGVRPYLAALAMMEAMGEFATIPTRAGSFSLSMKIGAARGRVLLGLVGEEGIGRDYYAAGEPLDDSAGAEHHASPGLIVLHPTAREHGGPALAAAPAAEGFWRLTAVLPGGESPRMTTHNIPPGALQAFVPPWLAERAGSDTLGEHRGTAVVFLSLAGFDWSDPAIHDRIARAFGVITAAARRYGGVLNKLDMGDKGAKGVLLFGAPYALERKEEMATRAALECIGSSELPEGLALRAGVTSAPLFSGPVGAPSRREFTVMGDGINLAARLMTAAAPGQVLASRAVSEGSSGLVFEALDPIRVKGKAEPVEIFRPSGESGVQAAGLEEDLLERDGALAALRGHLFGEETKALAVLGGAGLGKTALARWAYRETKVRQVPAAYVPLAPYSAESPFAAWRGVVRQTLGLKRGDSSDAARAARERGLAHEEPGFRPALNPLLGLPDEESPALKGLSPKERKDLSFALVERLLGRAGERAILLDGLQWADPLSLELLESLLAAPGERPWRLAVFAREPMPAFLHEHWGRVELEPLSEAGTRSLLVERHGLYEVPDSVLAWFQQRARGNPGTLGALLESLKHDGLLVPGPGNRPKVDEDRLFKTVFPDTLEGLYLQQVDRLPGPVRRALQDASALGYSVSKNLLSHATALKGPELESALSTLLAEGLLRDDTRGERPYLAFAAPLVRDAVYAAVPFAQRREVHAAALRHLEAEGQGERPSAWPSLAQHAEAADDVESARRYHRLSGREALKRYDNVNAMRHLEFVCHDLTPAPDSVDDAMSLMDVYGFLGQRDGAVVLLDRLSALDGDLTQSHRARLRYFRAQACWQAQRWDEAEALLKESLALYEEAGDTVGVGKTLVNLVGGVYGPTGRLDLAEECLRNALKLPKGPGQSTFRVTAQSNLGAIFKHNGQLEQAAVQFVRAFRRASIDGLPTQQALAACNLCGVLYELGRFDRAIARGQTALRLSRMMANRRLEQETSSNLSMALLAFGRTTQAAMIAQPCLVIAQTQQNQYLEGQALQILAQCAQAEGRLSEALVTNRKAYELLSSSRHMRDALFTEADLLRLLRSVGASAKAGEVTRRLGSRAKLRSLAAEYGLPSAFLPLAGIDESGQTPDLDSLFWRWYGSPDKGRGDILAQMARCGSAGASNDILLAVSYAFTISGAPFPPYVQPLRLLRKQPWGVWSTRLAAALYRQVAPAIKAPYRLMALHALYRLKARSPDWAWRCLLAHSEIGDVLRGTPSGPFSLR